MATSAVNAFMQRHLFCILYTFSIGTINAILHLHFYRCGPEKFANSLGRCIAGAGKVTNNTDHSLCELTGPDIGDKSPKQAPYAHAGGEAESPGDDQREDKSHRSRIKNERTAMTKPSLNVSSKEMEGLKTASKEDRSRAEPAVYENGPMIEAVVDEEGSSKTNRSNYTASPKSKGKSRGYSTTGTSSGKHTDVEAHSNTLEGQPPILLVDDNDINLSILKALMRRAKRRYEAVHNGLEAVHAYERASKHPDTAFTHVLMDISMPVMDGITATRVIRGIERNSTLERPTMVVALTALASETTQKEMFEAGGDYFMPKPIKFKELLQLLDR